MNKIHCASDAAIVADQSCADIAQDEGQRTPAAATVDARSTSLKRCSWCHVVKTRQEYHVRNASADGMKTMCKECCTIYARLSKQIRECGLALVRT